MKHITSRIQHLARQTRRKAHARTASRFMRQGRRIFDLVFLAAEVRDAIRREQERAMNYAGIVSYEVAP